MAAKEILYTNDARTQIGNGLNQLANAVKVTLGPRGRNVALDSSWGAPTITKDGVTVAGEMEFEDHFANMGAQMVKQVATQTADSAGDGTTTATVLAQAIYAEGVKLVTAGTDPMALKRGIDVAVTTVVEELKRLSKPIQSQTEIAQVGKISANGDETIGDLIAEAMEKVGKEGIVTVADGTAMETTLEVTMGMQLDRGYLSPYFVTDATHMKVSLDEPYILLHEERITNIQSLVPLLEKITEAQRPLLLISEVEGEALALLVVNKLKGALQVCAIKPPSYGDSRKEILEDIATIVGGRSITAQLGIKLETLTLADLGRAKSVLIDRESTIIIDGHGTKPPIDDRIRQLRNALDNNPSEHDRMTLEQRVAKLSGGVAVIKVGAATESEMKEKKARVVDAVHATRAAVAEGIVPGGGVALLRAIPALKKLTLTGDEQYGVNVLRQAIEAPLRQIAKNSGQEGAVVVDAVCKGKGSFGYNAATDSYEDLVQAGVIDPTKVVRVALENAASVASMMLTTEVTIAQRTHPRRKPTNNARGRAGTLAHS